MRGKKLAQEHPSHPHDAAAEAHTQKHRYLQNKPLTSSPELPEAGGGWRVLPAVRSLVSCFLVISLKKKKKTNTQLLAFKAISALCFLCIYFSQEYSEC